jgi:hypothetical protein
MADKDEEEEDIEALMAYVDPPSAEEINTAEPDAANGGGVAFMEEDERVFNDAAEQARANARQGLAREEEDTNDRGNYFTAADLGFSPDAAGGPRKIRTITGPFARQRQRERLVL